MSLRRVLSTLLACAALAAAPPLAAQPAEGATTRVFRGRNEDEWIREMGSRPVVRVVSRHHSTAIVYRVDLGDGIEIGFKPERPGQERWWRHEIVSYRLARLLGIVDRVPPVVSRRIPFALFGRLVARAEVNVSSDGTVPGSASVWMPVLRGEHLHDGPAREAWNRWMEPGAEIPAESRERARQIAQLLVFDYLMANFDRWNCCNIPIDERGQIVFRDNDAGWFPHVMSRMGSATVVRRLPRSLYAALRRATPAALRAEVERDPERGLILAGALRAYETRRQALLRHIEQSIAAHGEAAVMPWD